MIVGMFGQMPFLSSSLIVHTFQNFKRSSKQRYAQHEVIGLKPVLEATGPGLDEVSFSMRLDTQLGVLPLVSLNVLRAYQKLQEVHPLIIGSQYFGNFIITDISEDWRYFGATGAPRVINVNISLLENGQEWLNDTMVTLSDGFSHGYQSGMSSIADVYGGM